jgi:hypothetical protein
MCSDHNPCFLGGRKLIIEEISEGLKGLVEIVVEEHKDLG